MPWRKYEPHKGKYGPSYHIARGVQVRLDKRKQWTLFFEKSGKRQNQTFGQDRPSLVAAIKAAEAMADQVIEPVVHPVVTEPDKKADKSCFNVFSRNWFTNGLVRWSDLTEERYEAILRLYVTPSPLFQKPLDEIRRKDIKKFLRKIAKKRSPATVETVHGVISGIFNEAIDEELINANPCSGLLKSILPPKNQRNVNDPDPFSQGELEHFLDHAETTASRGEAMLLKCMAYAGLRLGEALAMRVEYLDVNKKTFFVTESYNRKTFRRPKHGKKRLVDLPDFLVKELVSYIDSLKKKRFRDGHGRKVDLLFVDPSEKGGLPYSQRKIQDLMKRVCKKAMLRIRNPHDLRHSYATILLMAHQSPGYVQKQLGHSSISITMDIYCHWIPGQGREGLEKALGGDNFCTKSVQQSHIIAYPKK